MTYYFCPHCHGEQISCGVRLGSIRRNYYTGEVTGKAKSDGTLTCTECGFTWAEISTFTPMRRTPLVDRNVLRLSIEFAFSNL